MEFDVLTPEFMEFAAKAKVIFDEKEKKQSVFKEVWVKHKQEIAELDKQAEKLKADYVKSLNQKKSDATTGE